jgi:hypothetical protein
MYRGTFDFLISMLDRLTPRKKQKRNPCPNCHGDHVELVNQIDDENGYWKKEEYLCYDCYTEWDWTYERHFFRWRAKTRPPRWVKID